MSRLPAVIGLVMCRRFDVDAQTGQVNLLGICHSLRYSRFPNLPEALTVYVHLYGGAAEGTIDLVIERLVAI